MSFDLLFPAPTGGRNADDMGMPPALDQTVHGLSMPTELVQTINDKPDYNMQFFGQDGKQIGKLDFNGPVMAFEGDAEESARVFFNCVAVYFTERLKEERERCAREIESAGSDCADWHAARVRAMGAS